MPHNHDGPEFLPHLPPGQPLLQAVRDLPLPEAVQLLWIAAVLVTFERYTNVRAYERSLLPGCPVTLVMN